MIIRILLIWLFALNGILAQELADSQATDLLVEQGSIFTVSDWSYPLEIISSDSLRTYVTWTNDGGKTFYIRKYNSNLFPVDSKIELFDKKDKKIGLESFYFNDSLYFLSANVTLDVHKYYVQRLSLADMVASAPEEIAAISYNERSPIHAFRRFVKSRNDSVIALFNTLPVRNRSQAQLKLTYFDRSFKSKTTYDYELPFENRSFTITRCIIGDDGSTYAVARVVGKEVPTDYERTRTYTYKLIKFDKEDWHVVAEFGMKSRYLHQLSYHLKDNNELVVSGVYGINEKFNVKGTYYLRLNLDTGEVIKKRESILPQEYLTALLSKEAKARGVMEDEHYFLASTALDTSDQVTLLLEDVIFEGGYGSGKWFTKNLGVIKLDANGEILWATKIGKNNSSRSFGAYAHFSPAIHEGNLILIYNGNKQNLNHVKGKVKKAFKKKDGAIIVATLSKDGSFERQVLLTGAGPTPSSPKGTRLSEPRVRPSLTFTRADGSILVYTERMGAPNTGQFLTIWPSSTKN